MKTRKHIFHSDNTIAITDPSSVDTRIVKTASFPMVVEMTSQKGYPLISVNFHHGFASFSVKFENLTDLKACQESIISIVETEGMYPVDADDIRWLVKDCSEGYYHSWVTSDNVFPTKDTIAQCLRLHPAMKSIFILAEGDVTLISVNEFANTVLEAVDDAFNVDSIDIIMQGKYKANQPNKVRCSIICFCPSEMYDLEAVINCSDGQIVDEYGLSEKCYSAIMMYHDNDPLIIDELFPGLEKLDINVKIRFSDKIVYEKKPYPSEETDRVPGPKRFRKVVCLGDFRASKAKKKTGTITLYTKAIAGFAKGQNISYETIFFTTLIHEYFHALHYQLFKQKGMEDRWSQKWCRDESRIVKETLAAFYEWYSCQYDFLCGKLPDVYKLAVHLADEWNSLDIDLWPYSGALVLADPDYNGMTLGKLFFRLLETSFTDWALAAKEIKALYYLFETGLGKADLDLSWYKP